MPNPIPATGTGSGGPPTVYDPYRALIDALRLPEDIFTLLKPTFDQVGFPLELDPAGVADFSKNPLPHYRAVTQNGKIVLLHVGSEVAANPYGQVSLFTIASPFLKQSAALFVFSEVDSFAFNTDDLMFTWQQDRPALKVRFVTLPLIQQMEFEPDVSKRTQTIRDLLFLDDLRGLAIELGVDDLIEQAYRLCQPDLLNQAPTLTGRLVPSDKEYVINFLADIAFNSPLQDSKKYFLSLLLELGLERDLRGLIASLFSGNPENDAKGLVLALEEKTFPEGTINGYNKILGYLLKLLADQGGGRKMALIIFKYRLITDPPTLQALVNTYP